MSDVIEIYYKSNNLKHSDIVVQVNQQLVDFKLTSTTITVVAEINAGIHELTLSLDGTFTLEIVDVLINCASVRELLYLSWMQEDSQKIQPCTQLQTRNQVWHLPFGNPVSYWLSLICSKLPPGVFGTDLYKKYHIQYPNKIVLPDSYPQFIKDYFATDFDITVTELDQAPVVELNIDPEMLTSLINRVQLEYNTGQFDHLSQDGPPESGEVGWHWWRLFDYNPVTKTAEPKLHRDEFKELFEVLDTLNIQDMYLCDIAFLKPGAYIAPHRDWDKNGHREFFIPLHSPPGNYIKFAGVESWDIKQRSCMLNIVDFTHCVVNTSNQVRSVMLIRCDVTKNTHLVGTNK